MPAPKLLDKKLISAAAATERRQQIVEGMKLTAAIQALRETKEKEEKDLETMRVNTLAAIEREVSAKQVENDRISAENRRLKEERIRLEAPLDLQEAWAEVSDEKRHNQAVSDDLLSREISITKRENDVRDSFQSVLSREKDVQVSEASAEENLRQAEAQREEATLANQEAQTLLSDTRQKAKNDEAKAKAREASLDLREAVIEEREQAALKAELNITNEKILLADRRATLERGFEELRRKQNGLHR